MLALDACRIVRSYFSPLLSRSLNYSRPGLPRRRRRLGSIDILEDLRMDSSRGCSVPLSVRRAVCGPTVNFGRRRLQRACLWRAVLCDHLCCERCYP